jgi:hypothetical protein
MKHLPGFKTLIIMICPLLTLQAVAQNLSPSMSFAASGSFINGVAQSSNSILLADNDLTNGYDWRFDMTDAPTSLDPSGPKGSAAFQWGVIANNVDYPHTSALWFEPLALTNIAAEQLFNIGYLFYRNGTIKSTTGASSVDLAMNMSFSQPLGMSNVSEIYGLELINTPNSSDPVKSADIVSMLNQAAPIDYTDAKGNRYYLELSFKVDQDTIDGTLSTVDQFKVFEGGQGSATLQGRFTTNPGGPLIPEPSTAILAMLGTLVLFRRKR